MVRADHGPRARTPEGLNDLRVQGDDVAHVGQATNVHSHDRTGKDAGRRSCPAADVPLDDRGLRHEGGAGLGSAFMSDAASEGSAPDPGTPELHLEKV